MTDINELEDENYKSKTQIKKEMLELKDLGATLLEVPLTVYKSFPIPEELDEALSVARKIKSNSALKRQLQYIGKIMRSIDIEPIESAYDEWKNGRKRLARELHKIEDLRDELLSEGSNTLNEIISEHPQCDIQQLRQLIRLTKQEKEQNKPPKNYRKLFQFIKELYIEE